MKNNKIIKEGLGDNKFTTPLNKSYLDIQLDRTQYPDHDIDDARAFVNWEVDIEARSWGIKSISPSVLAISISYDIIDPESVKTIETKEIEWTYTNPQGYKLEIGVKSEGDQLVPSYVTLDEQEKTIVVDF
jgi:hypothetical protein